MKIVSQAKYLNSYIQYYLKKHFDNFRKEYKLSICIFQCRLGINKKTLNSELTSLLVRIKKNKGLNFCYKIPSNVRVSDSRLNSDGADKELVWVMLSNRKSEAMKILSRIILTELSTKYEDMMVIEDMKNLPKLMQIDGNKKVKFFFENIENKKWLLDKYVSEVISDYRLPNSQMLVAISAMSYEKRAVATRMYFSDRDLISRNKSNIYFGSTNERLNKVQITEKNLRAVRKLMEMSGRGYGLWVKKSDFLIEGIVKDSRYKTRMVYVTFNDYMAWSINKGKEVILGYREGKYYIPDFEPENDNVAQIKKLMKLCTMGISEQKINEIKELIERVSKVCQHGTSLVFMEETSILEEIDKRLVPYKKAYRLQPFPMIDMEDDALRGIAAIDGAIFVDLDCKCHAAGVIVDGKTVREGDSGRGARYNSLTNYIVWYKKQPKHHDDKCFVVIFSEDGMINVEIP